MKRANSERRIRALVLDIDGVLTDGRVAIDQEDREAKSLAYRDADALAQARREGLQVALLTGETSPMAQVIIHRLHVETVVTGAKDKEAALVEVARRLELPLERLCYVGDADRDAPALAMAGLGLAPADASPKAKQGASRILAARGGYGAVAEAIEFIRRLNGSQAEWTASPEPRSHRAVQATAPVADRIVAVLQESIRVKQAAIESLAGQIATAAEWITETLQGGHKLLLFGNGGSAADAQHIAAEFVGRFRQERRAWPAIALSTDTSVLTALGNDYGFEQVFARQVEALAQSGDLAIALSTSGNSPNVIQGIVSARPLGVRTIGFSGQDGGRLAPLCDLALCIPSTVTARIQECHIAILHALCEVVETSLSD